MLGILLGQEKQLGLSVQGHSETECDLVEIQTHTSHSEVRHLTTSPLSP
jgi:hypothetical protein